MKIKSIFIIFMTLCLAFPIQAKKDGFKKGIHDYAYADGRVYSGNWLDHLPSGEGKMVMPNGDIYEGNWVLGHLQDYACIQRASGDIVKGRFANGNLVGEVTIQYVNGDNYVGTVKVEKDAVVLDYITILMRHGYGTFKSAEGDVTVGTFENDKPVGKVKIVYADKDEFDGTMDAEGNRTGLYKELKDDGETWLIELENDIVKNTVIKMEEGEISIEYRDEKQYVKKFTIYDSKENMVITYNVPYPEFCPNFVEEGLRDGQIERGYGTFVGTMKGTEEWNGIYKNYKDDEGNIYNGPVLNGVLHGECSIERKDGAKIVGTFVNGELCGNGTFTYLDGGKFIGEFKDGKCNGQGTRIWADGGKFEGIFKDDKEWKGEYTNITFYNEKDSIDGHYTGHLENGMLSGNGTYIFNDGTRYVGQFANGARHGQGTMYDSDGNKYVGQWVNGKINGQGTMYYSDGNKYVGQWVNGKRHGQGTFIYLPGYSHIKLTGTFFNDSFCKGKLFRSNGTVVVGQWDEDGNYLGR